MKRNFVVGSFGDDDNTNDQRTGEPYICDDMNDEMNEITSKMFDLMGCRMVPGPVATIPGVDGTTTFPEKAYQNINRTYSRRKKEENKIRIPAVEISQNIANTVDKAWARELFEIRKEKREAIQEELHGVQSRAVPETQGTIGLGLLAMEMEISEIVAAASSSSASSASRKLVEGHLLATTTLGSDYVVAPEFRLRFLRAEFFDAANAARRYFKNLNYLLRYFGECALMRPLEQTDLSRNQRRFLESGKLQILLNRDRMGRRMLLVFGATLTGIPVLDRFRVEDYLVYGAMAEDEETQLHGATCIVIFHPNGGTTDGEESGENDDYEKSANVPNEGILSDSDIDGMGWEENEKKVFKKLFRHRMKGREFLLEHTAASPVRWSSIHLCLPNNRVYHFFKAVIMGIIPPKYRSMTKIHIGSLLECTYEMLQFGIPAEDLGTTMKNNSLAKILRARTSIESFRRDFCSKHELSYYRGPVKLSNEQKEQDLQYFDTSIDITTDEIAAVSLTIGGAELPPKTNIDISIEAFCPGTDCPASNYVTFGDRLTYKYPANVAFREYLREFLRTKNAAGDGSNENDTKTSLRLNVKILDQIIDETAAMSYPGTSTAIANNAGFVNSYGSLSSKRFKFAVYDKKAGWYRYILPFENKNDRIELRKRISQTLRDDRKKHIMKNRRNHNPIFSSKPASTISTAFHDADYDDREEFDAKRLKTNHEHCFNTFHPCNG